MSLTSSFPELHFDLPSKPPSFVGECSPADIVDDLDLVFAPSLPATFYGGRGAPFERLQQLGSLVKVSAQLRHKSGDLLQFMPGEAPQLEAQLTICTSTGADLEDMQTMNLGRFPDHFSFVPTHSSLRGKRVSSIRIPFSDHKGVFAPLIYFPSFAIEVLSSQITSRMMKLKVASLSARQTKCSHAVCMGRWSCFAPDSLWLAT
jgi:hypothetical protein